MSVYVINIRDHTFLTSPKNGQFLETPSPKTTDQLFHNNRS